MNATLPTHLQPMPTRNAPPAMIDALRARFGERCSTVLAVREQHGRDESPFDVAPPDAVVFAESTAEVAQVVALVLQDILWPLGIPLCRREPLD